MSEEIHFNKKLTKQFHNLVERPLTLSRRIALLEAMESLITINQFIYPSVDRKVIGMKYLLATWEMALDGLLADIRQKDRTLLCRVISGLIQRQEFYLEENGFTIESRKLTDERRPLIRKYLFLLKGTLNEVIYSLTKRSSRFNLQFSAHVFAYASFRLPSFRKELFHALAELQSLSPDHLPDLAGDIFSAADNEEYDSFLSRAEQPEDMSTQPKDSMDMNLGPPTHLFNKSMEKTMNESLMNSQHFPSISDNSTIASSSSSSSSSSSNSLHNVPKNPFSSTVGLLDIGSAVDSNSISHSSFTGNQSMSTVAAAPLTSTSASATTITMTDGPYPDIFGSTYVSLSAPSTSSIPSSLRLANESKPPNPPLSLFSKSKSLSHDNSHSNNSIHYISSHYVNSNLSSQPNGSQTSLEKNDKESTSEWLKRIHPQLYQISCSAEPSTTRELHFDPIKSVDETSIFSRSPMSCVAPPPNMNDPQYSPLPPNYSEPLSLGSSSYESSSVVICSSGESFESSSQSLEEPLDPSSCQPFDDSCSPYFMEPSSEDLATKRDVTVDIPLSPREPSSLGRESSPKKSPKLGTDASIRPLMVRDFACVVDEICLDSFNHSQSDTHSRAIYRRNHVSLFYWGCVNDATYQIPGEFNMLERLRVKDMFLMSVCKRWFDVVTHYEANERDVANDCIPGYYLVLRIVLPEIQECILRQYNWGSEQTSDSDSVPDALFYYMTSYDLCTSLLCADPDLLNTLLEMCLTRCNPLLASDVRTLMTYLDNFMDFFRSSGNLCMRTRSLTHLLPLPTTTINMSENSNSLPMSISTSQAMDNAVGTKPMEIQENKSSSRINISLQLLHELERVIAQRNGFIDSFSPLHSPSFSDLVIDTPLTCSLDTQSPSFALKRSLSTSEIEISPREFMAKLKSHSRSFYRTRKLSNGFIKQHALMALMCSGIAQSHGEAVNIWDSLFIHGLIKEIGFDIRRSVSLYRVTRYSPSRFTYSDVSIPCLPRLFSYSALYESLRVICQNEGINSLKHVLMFIYKYYKLFQGHARYVLFLTVILNDHFYGLFCHWDKDIRTLMYNILVFGMLQTQRHHLPCLHSLDILLLLKPSFDEQLSPLPPSFVEPFKRVLIAERNKANRGRSPQPMDTNSLSSTFSFTHHTNHLPAGRYDDILMQSMENEAVAIDLVLSSKCDVFLRFVIDQANGINCDLLSDNSKAIVPMCIVEYVTVLREYEKRESKSSNSQPIFPPILF